MGTCTECVQKEDTIHLEENNKKKNIDRNKQKLIKPFPCNNSQKQVSTKNTNNTQASKFIDKKIEDDISSSTIIDLNSENSHLVLYYNENDHIKNNCLTDRNTFFKEANNNFSNNEIEKSSINQTNTNKNIKGYKIKNTLFEFDEENENKITKDPKNLKQQSERENFNYNFSCDKDKNCKNLSNGKIFTKQREKTNYNFVEIDEMSDKEENKQIDNSFDSKQETILVDNKKNRKIKFKVKTKDNREKEIKSRTFYKGFKKSLLK